MAIIQKPLDWARRFLFNTSVGDLPLPGLVLPITHDWPLRYILRAPADFVTIAGTVNTPIYAPSEQNHGMVIYAGEIVTAGVNILSTDQVFVSLLDKAGPAGVRLYSFRNIATGDLNLIGGRFFNNNLAHVGLDPVYVPPGALLQVENESVAGGITIQLRAWILEVPASYPLRLP